MNDSTTANGTLIVSVDSNLLGFKDIPKQIQVLDSKLYLTISAWINNSEWQAAISPGVYLVRIFLTSENEAEHIVEVKSGQETKIEFHINPPNANSSEGAWLALKKFSSGSGSKKNKVKNPSIPKFKTDTLETFTDLSGGIWSLESHTWKRLKTFDIQTDITGNVQAEYTFDIRPTMTVMEVAIRGKLSIFVCLPCSPNVKCIIKSLSDSRNPSRQIEIFVSTANSTAQSLLSLLRSGDTARAKTLISLNSAENLLYGKEMDPVGAAIGGYFLLRSGELARMHNWAQNLANWFEWMPDGAIIHAWQMIQEQETLGENVEKIRSRLLDAVNRGIPIYTEGLRLLYEGLNMFWFHSHESDVRIEAALNRVRGYLSFADMSQETTTFTGTFPDLPGGQTKNKRDHDLIRHVKVI